MLAEPPWGSWQDGLDSYRHGELDVVSALLLAHPMWRTAESKIAVQGPRHFEDSESARFGQCQAHLLWGYACSLGGANGIQFDHLFPRSLGGPTVVGNRLSLCRFHNAGKAGDVHFFPWEIGEPSWLAQLLKNIEDSGASLT